MACTLVFTLTLLCFVSDPLNSPSYQLKPNFKQLKTICTMHFRIIIKIININNGIYLPLLSPLLNR